MFSGQHIAILAMFCYAMALRLGMLDISAKIKANTKICSLDLWFFSSSSNKTLLSFSNTLKNPPDWSSYKRRKEKNIFLPLVIGILYIITLLVLFYIKYYIVELLMREKFTIFFCRFFYCWLSLEDFESKGGERGGVVADLAKSFLS